MESYEEGSMYSFVDIKETSEGITLPSEAMQINGEYLEDLVPGYKTLGVSGREALSPEIESFHTGIRDGSSRKSRRYPERIITVKYQLISKSNEEFREAYNKLGGVLNTEDAQLIFRDEPDKYFIGTPSLVEEVEQGRNAVVGELEFLCLDPFKYSVVEYEAIPDMLQGSILLDYRGTYKSFPILEADFYRETDTSADGSASNLLTGRGDCGFVAFFNETKKIIQLGDPDEADTENKYQKSQTLVSAGFEGTSGWGSAAKTQWTQNASTGLASQAVQVGSMGMGIASYAVPATPKDTSGTILSNKATSQSSPVFYYSITAKTTNRNANSVKVTVTVTASLKNTGSYFGPPYALQGQIYLGGAWRTFTIKKPSEFWRGKTAHTVNFSVTVTGLSASTSALTGIKFKTARTDGTGGSAGVLPETTCANLPISQYVADVPETYFLTASAFGSGSGWHGPSITRKLPQDASGVSGAVNGQLSFSHKMSIGNGNFGVSELGGFQVLLVNGSGSGRKIVAGAFLYKGSNGKSGKVIFYINGTAVETIDIDFSYGNKRFQAGVSSTITKTGDTVTFNLGGISRTFSNSAIRDMAIHEITFAFLQYAARPRLSFNGLYSAKFVKSNCQTWKDIPNKFSANDVLEADCQDGNVYLNGVLNQSLGALGNDWEGFYLTPGLNQIGFTYSDWVPAEYAPAFKVRYREVFL
jgi:predicted phage tail component-like protein